jgi:type IV fimbrial biogenesis protein FimT
MGICRGFTLLELMVTIAVLAILTTVGVPSFRLLVQNNRVTTQTNELVTALNVGRTEAVKRGRNVQVAVTVPATGWAATVSVAGVGGEVIRVVDRAGSAVTLQAGETVVFAATGAPLNAFTFNMQPTGCSGQQRRQIALGASGQITTSRQPCT